MSLPYPYPVSNSDLLRDYNLESHFEGGFFKQTVALSSRLQDGVRVEDYSGSGTDGLKTSPGSLQDQVTDATCIYYLITPECSRGRMHMNNHATFHIHHAGRALYTLIAPPTGPGAEPVVYRVVMGSDPSKGEVTQLFVPGGWWKASEMPKEDLLLLDAANAAHLKERLGCLISEVVVPGWTPEQHQFLTEEKVYLNHDHNRYGSADDQLKAMWGNSKGWETYIPYLSGPK